MQSKTGNSQINSAPASPLDLDWQYTGRELESMSFAVNYHRWILNVLQPFLGKRIVEIGAGAGSLSRMLLEFRPEFLAALEPSANMFPELVRTLAEAGKGRFATAYQATLEGWALSNPLPSAPDTVVYINVLEHIENDERELELAHSLLAPGGRILIFVPALQSLMSRMDRQLGHFRRYSRPDLVYKCRAAGFRVLLSHYFDGFGILPWWVKFRLLGSVTMEPGAVRLYDNLVVPFARILENAVPPPLGKNVILAAEKLR